MKVVNDDLERFARSGKTDVIIMPTVGRTADLGKVRFGENKSEKNGHLFITLFVVVVHDCSRCKHIDLTALYRSFLRGPEGLWRASDCIRKNGQTIWRFRLGHDFTVH